MKKLLSRLSKKVKILIVVILIVILLAVGLGVYFGVFFEAPHGINLEEYLSNAKLVWGDEFDGNTLDESKWSIQGKGEKIARRGGYWTEDAIKVIDGNLVISTYKDNGYYHSGALITEDKYESKFGYYEIRCILPKAYGIWSAFWMMPTTELFELGETNANKAGAEIDIFEAPAYPNLRVQQAFHIGGYEKNHKSTTNPKWLTASYGDIYDSYHTYGLYWDEKTYVYYVDGVEVWSHAKKKNISHVLEYLFLSVEVGGYVDDNGLPVTGVAWNNPLMFKNPDFEGNDWSKTYNFAIDYVRHYQIEQ